MDKYFRLVDHLKLVLCICFGLLLKVQVKLFVFHRVNASLNVIVYFARIYCRFAYYTYACAGS